MRFPSASRIERDDPDTYNWHTNLLYPQSSGGGPNQNTSNFGGIPFYYQDGFLAIQDRINYFFVKTLCDNAACEIDDEEDKIPNIYLQRFPYPPYTEDTLQNAMELMVGLLIMLSFIYIMTTVIQFIAVEKEKELKDVMAIMEMPFWLHFVSWFCHIIILMTIPIIFMTAFLKVIDDVFDNVSN